MEWLDIKLSDPETVNLLLLPVYVLTWAVFMFIEWRKPARDYPKIRGWTLFGIFFLFFGHISSIAMFAVIPEETLRNYRVFDLTWLGIPGGVLFMYVTESFVYYWYHRAQHHFTFLWHIHQTHHSIPRFNTAASFILHPFDSGANFIFDTLLFVFVFGAHPTAVLIAAYITFVYTTLEHCNFRTPRWLGYITVRPEQHHLHHAIGVHRWNYSDWPMLWDRLFGTYREPGNEPDEVGFGHPSWFKVLPDSLLLKDVSSRKYFKRKYGSDEAQPPLTSVQEPA